MKKVIFPFPYGIELILFKQTVFQQLFELIAVELHFNKQ